MMMKGISIKVSDDERQMLNILKMNGINISQIIRNSIRTKYKEVSIENSIESQALLQKKINKQKDL
jgi:hypothetical protein